MPTYPSTASCDPKLSPYVPTTSGNWKTQPSTVQDALDASVPLIYKQVTTLTDAQIKAFPATPPEIVPAPESGKMIVVINAMAVKNFVSGYLGIISDEAMCLSVPNFNSYATGPARIGSAAFGGLDDAGQTILSFPGPAETMPTGGTLSNTVVSADSVAGQNSNGAPLQLFQYSFTQVPYSGGHPDNTLKIVVFYTLIDI